MINKTILTLLSISFLFTSYANNNYWYKASETEIFDFKAKIKTTKSAKFFLNYNKLNDILNLKENQTKTIDIPFPNGEFVSFIVSNNTSMAKGLKAKFEDIKTFDAYNKTLNIRGKIDITHKGFHAMLFTTEGTLYVDPYSLNSNELHLSYWKKDFISNEIMVCKTEDKEEEIINEIGKNNTANGIGLRTYDIAVSATGEYTQFHGGTVADGLAAIVTTINRISGVYEKDLSITFQLVSNNDLIVYTNASTDPFSAPSNIFTTVNENQTSITNVIGTANFDIGHVVGASGGGGFGPGDVCDDSKKAKGTTARSNPVGDPFDIDYVAHEVGHQFSGSHTYNGQDGSCSNTSVASAFEPGSGSTIMAYAGICSQDNIQNHSNDYFHARSIQQIVTYTTVSGGSSCAELTTTENNKPTLENITPSSYVIPKSTPFELSASATDIDDDVVTYCWEQYDLGPQGDPNSPVGNAPLFRSFSPKTEGNRIFPQISDIINNTQTKGEILPSYQRNMTFKVTFRDGKGATEYANTSVGVSFAAGPFTVTTQNTNNIIWTAGQQKTISWDVANTSASPVDCQQVSVLLSIDGGFNFPIVLKQGISNTGTTNIVVPNYFSNNARIKVKAFDNIFFNINEKDIKLNTACDGVVPSTISITRNYLTITSSYSGTNKWFKNGNIIPGETGSSIVVSDAGTYHAEANEQDCLSAPSNKISVSQNVIGINELKNNYTVFPNPAKDILTINLKIFENDMSIKILDILGSKVFEKTAMNATEILDVSHLTKGIYYLVISNSKTVKSQKIIIE